ncbi:MAG: hypothetical protein KAJ42_00580 [Gemmatimonadetes bacterium]|nr:hypothetical protein [Gemmatimonadota bacterium]
MRESHNKHRSAPSSCRGQDGWKGLVLRAVLATTFFLIVGCAPRPALRSSPQPPLILVFDGTRLPGAEADSILQEQIKGRDIDSIRVLKGSRALAEYGPEAEHGVILIYLKERGIADGSV